MEGHRWDDDEVLLADLAEVMREVLPLAGPIAERAQGALAWRTVDTDLLLAALSFDSSTESSGSSRADDGGHRVLVFRSERVTVEVELQFDRVVGQLLPPSAGDVSMESADGARVRVATDDLGFFLIPGVPRGSVRLHCETPAARLVTDWFHA